ncbi:MAG: methyl-accepting chemotaxis protein [Candidatus Kryptoniota bacterium]
MRWFYNLKIGEKILFSFLLLALTGAIIGYVGILNLENLVTNLTVRVTIALIMFGLIAAGLGLFLSQILSAPVKHLKEATTRLARGDTNVKVDVKSKDELGTLAANFNLMADAVSNAFRLQEYLDLVPAPVMAITREFTIEYINKFGTDLLGKTQSELIGTKCYDSWKTGQCRTEKCALAQAMESGSIVTEQTMSNPNGKSLPVMYTGAPIRDKNSGNIIGALEYVVDITTLKELQNYLSDKITEILHKMDDFAEGDLTVKLDVEKDDDIGRLFTGFNKAVDNIEKMVQQIIEAVETTASAATQISSSSEELSAGVQEQSAQSGEVAAAVEEMTRTIIENSRNAQKTAEAATDNGKMAEDGKKIVLQTTDKMKKISGVVAESAEMVEKLGESSKQIGDIVSVIDDIADQTNLLALNAAIEAARAGEQGKGFAVVADEVRQLAERTIQATKEIEAMIKAIQNETQNAVSSMKSTMKEVEEGIALADEARDKMIKISSQTKNVVDMINQIAAASEEQSATSEEISKNVEAISSVSSESAAGVSQIAQAADNLNRLTEKLRNMVTGFKLKQEAEQIRERETNGIHANPVRAQIYGNRTHVLNIEHAKSTHRMWKMRLTNCMAGKEHIDETEAGDYHNCSLGKWYYSDAAKKYRGKSIFTELGKWHADLHKIAGDIVRLCNNNKFDEARSKLPEIDEPSKHVVLLLDRLKEMVTVDG